MARPVFKPVDREEAERGSRHKKNRGESEGRINETCFILSFASTLQKWEVKFAYMLSA